jgi:hypothetical protein
VGGGERAVLSLGIEDRDLSLGPVDGELATEHRLDSADLPKPRSPTIATLGLVRCVGYSSKGSKKNPLPPPVTLTPMYGPRSPNPVSVWHGYTGARCAIVARWRSMCSPGARRQPGRLSSGSWSIVAFMT